MPNAVMIDDITSEAMELLGGGRMVTPFSARFPGFGLAQAYAVTARIRDLREERRGETAVGRKIGFTNTAIWESYGIQAPIWGYMYDTTVHDLGAADVFALAGLPEPRIEPEIALHLAQAPSAGMIEAELIGCIDWIAPAFEVVYSIFPGWKFAAADAVAAFGVHAALYLGERRDVTADRARWAAALAGFDVEMGNTAGVTRTGHARNVLGSPLRSLGFLIDELARIPGCEPLRAGEIVTTGTLTEAMPISPGDVWSTRFAGADLAPLRLAFR